LYPQNWGILIATKKQTLEVLSQEKRFFFIADALKSLKIQADTQKTD